MKTSRLLLAVVVMAATAGAYAQGRSPQMRPPAFFGGPPGVAQFQAIQIQRHQARTLLYREALEELSKNPAAADVPECAPAQKSKPGALCLVRSPQPAKPAAEALTAPVVHGRRLAVLFGNNDYQKPIPKLETPVADVSKTAEILKNRFGYEARVVKNAGKADIIEALNKVAAEASPDDSVLLFYAGHGYELDDTRMGFWIPVDASVKTAAGWISNTDISKQLAAIRARQVILVSDSCFSGSLTKEQKVTYSGAPNAEEVLRRRSVLVLTSGGEEPVSDEGKEGHSVFAWNLMKALQAANGITPGYEVYRTVHRDVMRDAAQEPQYGAVVSAGHSAGGEYLFEASKP
jgi:hypothetical protein